LAQFKLGDFSTSDMPLTCRRKTVTTQDFIDQIHEIILEDSRIITESIAEQLGFSHQGFWSSFQEDLGMSKLSTKWSRNA
jgi:hypothetical protein